MRLSKAEKGDIIVAVRNMCYISHVCVFLELANI